MAEKKLAQTSLFRLNLILQNTVVKCSILFTFAWERKIAKCANGCGDKFCLNPMESEQSEEKKKILSKKAKTATTTKSY